MQYLKNYLDILNQILQDVCINNTTVSKSTVYNYFNKLVKTDIEKYRFLKELSELINNNQITGYEIKVGRNGGIIKKCNIIEIKISYPDGEVVGNIEQNTLPKILAFIKSK